MSVTRDIAATYRAPAQVLGRLLSDGAREDRALAHLMLACLLMFVAQTPRLMREAILGGEVPFEVSLGAALFGWLFLAPLFFYFLAGAAHLLGLLLGGRGTWYGARLAMFWALLAAAPLWLAAGLAAGFAGPGRVAEIAGVAPATAFLVIWVVGFRVTEFGRVPATASED